MAEIKELDFGLYIKTALGIKIEPKPVLSEKPN